MFSKTICSAKVVQAANASGGWWWYLEGYTPYAIELKRNVSKANISVFGRVSVVAGNLDVLCGVNCMCWRKRWYASLRNTACTIFESQNVGSHFQWEYVL